MVTRIAEIVRASKLYYFVIFRSLLGKQPFFLTMKLARIIVGEILVLGASILIFRSVWTLLDQYFGTSNLWSMLIIGILVTIAGLIIINHEVKCELNEKKTPNVPKIFASVE